MDGAGVGLAGGAIVTISVGVDELDPPQDANKNEVQNNTPSEGSKDEVSEVAEDFSKLYNITKFPNKICHTIIITSLKNLSSTN